ncbi:uncharacterized protein LOC131254155 [Magnolia sinica]|uniref:uncharacterized protein LOC131254155 n=1 Tax=Magnolia sinica TaxID=86752 RepID=UPI00265A1A99|nr:uncharacterized protein LOC131254155 [Magnolia sinica]
MCNINKHADGYYNITLKMLNGWGRFRRNIKEEDEPFIHASQAAQVFYCKDPTRDDWHVVLDVPKRLTKDAYAFEDPLVFEARLTACSSSPSLVNDLYDPTSEDIQEGSYVEIVLSNPRIMSYVGPSSSAPGSTTKIKVSISPVGEITGDNKNQFTSFLGNVVRTYCPIAYKDWRLVPDTIKDNVWSTVLAKYDVGDSDGCKTAIIKRANDMWKDWKNRLRGTVLDMYDNDGDRKKNCPNGVKLEDWVKFVDYESIEEAKSRRGKGKESRSEMKFPHTTGRQGSVRTAELIVSF